jgi:hypothetical protein
MTYENGNIGGGGRIHILKTTMEVAGIELYKLLG